MLGVVRKNVKDYMKSEIIELIEALKKKKFEIILTNTDDIISIKKTTLCDRLIKVLEQCIDNN